MSGEASSSGRGDHASDLQARLRALPLFARDFIAGGVAGGLAKTSVAPLERTKILFQTRGGEMTSVTGTLRFMWQNEGMWGLFKGNGASVLRIVPYAALHFSSFESYKRAIHAALDRRAQAAGAGGASPQRARADPQHHAGWDLLAGSLSGATAVAATYPLDLVRTRLAWATEAPGSRGRQPHLHHHHHHLTIRGMLRQTLQKEGVAGLYRGMLPTVLGILPYAGIKFFTYQTLKDWYRARQAALPLPLPPGSPAGVSAAAGDFSSSGISAAAAEAAPQPRARLPLHLALLFGGISGLVGQTLTYPLDVIRRQMQVEGMREAAAALQATGLAGAAAGVLAAGSSSGAAGSSSSSSSGGSSVGAAPGQRPTVMHIARAIVKQSGVRGLLRGLSLNYIKAVPSTAVGWTVYEACKTYLGCNSML